MRLRYKHAFGTLFLVAGLLALWQILALNPDIAKKFSSPYEVFKVLTNEIQNASFWHHVIYSYRNITLGFLLGNFIGAFIGTILWLNESIGRMVNPILFTLSSIPVFAIAPMTILWWGTGDFAKVMIVFLHVFFVAVFYTHRAIGEIRQDLYSFYKDFIGMNNFQTFRHLILPSYILWFPEMLKFTVNFAVLGEFVAEFIVSDKGIGHYIIRATGLYDVPRVLVGIIFLMLYSIALTSVINMYNKYVRRKFFA